MYHHGYTSAGLRYFAVSSRDRDRRTQLMDSASIVTPAPYLPKKRKLLFEDAFRSGAERRNQGMDLDY